MVNILSFCKIRKHLNPLLNSRALQLDNIYCVTSTILPYRDCKSNALICDGQPHILFAWALNASGLHLPTDVGVQIGPSVGINSVIVQIHYGYPESE